MRGGGRSGDSVRVCGKEGERGQGGDEACRLAAAEWTLARKSGVATQAEESKPLTT